MRISGRLGMGRRRVLFFGLGLFKVSRAVVGLADWYAQALKGGGAPRKVANLLSAHSDAGCKEIRGVRLLREIEPLDEIADGLLPEGVPGLSDPYAARPSPYKDS